MVKPTPYYQRVRYAVQKVGGQSELARRVGRVTQTKVDPQNIQYLCREGARSSRLTGPIAEAAELNLNWMMTGLGNPEDLSHGPELVARSPDGAYAVMQARQVKTPTKTAEGSYRLPRFNVEPAAGLGTYPPDHEEVIDQMTVTGEWIRKNLSITSIRNLAVLTGYGDSMEGTFNSGDPLLVDRGVNEIKIDAVFVLQRFDVLFVKRCQRQLDGGLLIISDNKKYEAQRIAPDDVQSLQVLGRVVYCWNGRKL